MPFLDPMRNAAAALLVALTACPQLAVAQRNIPPGTIVPVELRSTLSSEKTRVGQTITAKVMQDVPLPAGKKIPVGSKVIGVVETVKPASSSHPGEITFRFARIEYRHEPLPIRANLRALASFMEVEGAQVPLTGPDRGTPYNWATRELVGGQVAYGDGGPVVAGTHVVGRVAVGGGVLASIGAKPDGDVPEPTGRLRLAVLASNPAGVPGCPGDVLTNPLPQALWVFSTDACGVFGIRNMHIVRDGTTDPVGQITVAAKHGKVKIQSGTGLLLRVSKDAN